MPLNNTAEATLDAMIASGVDPAIAKSLLSNPAFYTSAESLVVNLKIFAAPDATAISNTEAGGTATSVAGGPHEIVITEGTPLSSGQKSLKVSNQVRAFISNLPAEEAQAAMLGLSLITGGVVKTALDVAKDTALTAAVGDEVRALQVSVAQALAAGASGVDVDTHKKFLDIEAGQGFTTEQQGGAEFVLEMAGLGTGATVAKKIGESSGKLPDGYNRNTDGAINGPSDGTLIDTGFQNDGQTVYQRVGENGPGSYFTIGNDNLQKPVKSPRSKTDIGEQYAHHKNKVDEQVDDLQAKGIQQRVTCAFLATAAVHIVNRIFSIRTQTERLDLSK